MSHARTRVVAAAGRRPLLLALVFGIFLVLVGLTASALVVISSAHLTSSTLHAVVSRDRSLVELYVQSSLRGADLDADGPTPERGAELDEQLRLLATRDRILQVEILSLDGRVIASSLSGERDVRPPSEAMEAAVAGTPSATLLETRDAADAAGAPGASAPLVAEFLPIQDAERRTVAVVALWRDAAPLLASVSDARRDVMIITVAASVLVATILFFLFRAAHARISQQHAQLAEAARRDALTGLLNHGAVVTLLTERMEAARSRKGRIGVALLDIDNFRLLNDTHGHAAGDEVLLRVASVLSAQSGADASVARYGPDEFLLVSPGADAKTIVGTVDEVRRQLTAVAVQFGESEQLPVTVSAGVSIFPEHAGSVTELLSAAAVAVTEARAGGGDAVRVARIGDEEHAISGSFDVLQGLVIAVDTKDRYTKRHSEDVARYATFLAERMGLDTETRRTIHLAGLLHDVGKIGIPDTLLRKPSKLTEQEFEVFKQHVALGDAIVRDLPHVEVVRAGIRHHHERWDGKGYLHGLEGDEIPAIARILAVADAFSAMTTTRPYRRALSITEALKRLGDAAGTQLQEDLVVAFIQGIETAPNAPLPGEEPAAIWRPELWVA